MIICHSFTTIIVPSACLFVVKMELFYSLTKGELSTLQFSFISMIGYQMAAVWKMGPQENFGTLLLALTLLFLLRYLDWYRTSDFVLTIVLATCMSLYKESYIMTLPFLVCLTIYRGRPESIRFSKTLTAGHQIGRRILCASLTALFITMLVLIWEVVYNGKVAASSDMSIVDGVIHDLPFISPGFCETGAKISASNTSYILKYADFVRKRKYFGPSQGPF